MKKTWSGILTLLLSVLVLFSCSTQPRSTSETEMLYRQVCSKCHQLPVVEELPFGRDEWSNLIADHLKNNGLDSLITITQSQQILQYINRRIPTDRKKK